MPRYRALIAYDGTDYCGFQRQRQKQPTIQGEIERALHTLTNQTIPVTGSGRTDSGVHAAGQVISFQTEWSHGPETMLRALNANLPTDIAVLELAEADASFHPRYAARSRVYQYAVYNHPVRSPLHGRFHWHVSEPLNLERMNEAAALLVGTHDFATFGTPPQGDSTVRQLFRCHWSRKGAILTFEVEGNAFLYRMVRSIVGSLRLVGDGSWSVADFKLAFQACSREKCGTVAPPQGLCLVSVKYDDD